MQPHQQDTSLSAAAGSEIPRRLHLASFQLLPAHLQETIISMACELPPSESRYGHCFRHRNPQPAMAMALVSKSFYAVVSSILYAHIRVTRTSSLNLLLAATIARPPLGRLIKSLHVGPDDSGFPHWEPIKQGQIMLRLWLPEDRGKWPAWIGGETRCDMLLDVSNMTAPSGAIAALKAAVESACCALDFDMDRPGRGRDGWLIPGAWHCRMFEVFAAVELYILAMRRYEDEAEDKRSPRYPRLVITGGPGSQPGEACEKDPNGSLVLSRSRLLQRLTARQAETDFFEHQLIFLRSGLYSDNSGLENPSTRISNFAAAQMTDEDAMDAYSAIDKQLEDPAVPASATIGGVLSLARALLSQTPLLQHLSLAGYLVSAVCGGRAPAELKRLRSLTLGPPPFRWSWPAALRFDVPAVASVERLRLNGYELTTEQAAVIVGRDGGNKAAFPNLRELNWSCAGFIGDEEPKASSLFDTIEVLAGRRERREDKGSLKRARESGDGNELSGSPRSLFIEVTLHQRDVEDLLAAAPTAATREAWRTGGAPDSAYRQQRRLHLVKISEHRAGGAGGFGLRDLCEMYEEGRMWLEKGARQGCVRC